MKIVIFVGPTIALNKARELCDAVFLPPVRQGDLISALRRYNPDRIGIIDGVFLQDLAVWHKEILAALEAGCEVWGASSMGALRAAELQSFGMVGIGKVFEEYHSGRVLDDDEVAMAHGPVETGYRKLSEPMINLRLTAQVALQRGLISEVEAAQFLSVCKTVYFPERTLPSILSRLAEHGYGDDAVQRIRAAMTDCYVDQKYEDAVLLLSEIGGRAANRNANFDLARSEAWNVLLHCDRKLERKGAAVSLASIARHAAIDEPDLEQKYFEEVDEQLAKLLASMIGIEVSREEIDLERRIFAERMTFRNSDNLRQWLSENDLTDEELEQIVLDMAIRRKVRNWWLTNVGGRPGKARLLLNAVRKNKRFDANAERAVNTAIHSERACALQIAYQQNQITLSDLYRSHAARTGFRVNGRLIDWIENSGFAGRDDFAFELIQNLATLEE